jgi:hypothetical protein
MHLHPPQQAVTTAVELVGTSLLSTKEALDTGWYNRRTQLYWFEQDFHKWQQIIYGMRSLEFTTEPLGFHGLIEMFNLSALLDRPIEWANLDFCSALHERRLSWIRDHIAPNMAKGGYLLLTTMRNHRGAGFMPKFIRDVYLPARKQTRKRLEDINGLSRHCMTDAALHTVMALQLAAPKLDLELDQYQPYGGPYRPAAFRFYVKNITTHNLVAAQDLQNFSRLLAAGPSLKLRWKRCNRGH